MSENWPERIARYLWVDRGLSSSPVRAFGLEWDSTRQAIAIPIEDRLKYHRADRTTGPKMWWADLTDAQRAQPTPPFPSWNDLRDPDCELVVEGEFDAMVAIANGVLAVTGTLGASTFTPEWAEAITSRGRPITIIYDHDEAGDKGAVIAADAITRAGGTALIAKWPNDRPRGWDATDHFRSSGSPEEFRAILAGAKPYEQTHPLTAFDADEVGRRFGEEPPPDQPDSGPVVVRLDSVEPEDVSWLWPGRVPVGKLTLIVGDPGLGKSTLTLYIAACVSIGRPLPDPE
jgi:hypothetical protein